MEWVTWFNPSCVTWFYHCCLSVTHYRFGFDGLSNFLDKFKRRVAYYCLFLVLISAYQINSKNLDILGQFLDSDLTRFGFEIVYLHPFGSGSRFESESAYYVSASPKLPIPVHIWSINTQHLHNLIKSGITNSSPDMIR